MASYFVGVDVGTGSVRACLVNEIGQIISSKVQEIKTWNPQRDFYQQSSDNIWAAVCTAIKGLLTEKNIDRKSVVGVGFDATCSLVVLDVDMLPLSVSPDGDPHQNIVLWMDHRAQKEVEIINRTNDKALQTVGGNMSLEMQPPKLMWLKENLPEMWKKAHHFFDLPDFLSWRATGTFTRSMCSLVCKWSYQAEDKTSHKWDDEFYTRIGLQDLIVDDHRKIGHHVSSPGSVCGKGLSTQAAEEMGLVPGTQVGVSLIDAHAGALACLSCLPKCLKLIPDLENRLVMIAGTSTCHIICSKERIPVPGVWGPFLSVVVPGYWANEGGQSAAGSLIDFVTSNHSAYPQVKKEAESEGIHVYDYLNRQLQRLSRGHCKNSAELTHDLHVWPDFHGNRSPIADPSLRGMVSGLSLSATEDDLALIYLATVQALAYSTRHIVSEMEKSGHKVSIVYLCGGLVKNSLYVQTNADVLGLPIILPETRESVLLGAAMLGASASGKFGTLQDVMSSMGGDGTLVMPDETVSRFHERKYNVFKELLSNQQKYANIMAR